MNPTQHTSVPQVEQARPHLGPLLRSNANANHVHPLYRSRFPKSVDRNPPTSGNPPPGGRPSRPRGPATRSRAGDRLRRFTFTLNNPSNQEYDSICATDCRWLIVGEETGDEGTPHLQGACILLTQKSFTAVKHLPGFARAHIEIMRGTPEQNKEYCTKEDTNAYEKGDYPKPGEFFKFFKYCN